MRIDWRTVVIIGVIIVIVGVGADRRLPVSTDSVDTLVIDSGLFVMALYFWRSAVRLPIALVIFLRRMRYALTTYGMGRREALFEGYTRAFRDRRRWRAGPLAMVDRLALVVIVMLMAGAGADSALVEIGGALGGLLLMLVYIYTGRFAFLLGEAPEGSDPAERRLPYIDLDG